MCFNCTGIKFPMSRKESKFFYYLSNYKLLNVTARRNYFCVIIRVFTCSLHSQNKDDYDDGDDDNNNNKYFKYIYLYITMSFFFWYDREVERQNTYNPILRGVWLNILPWKSNTYSTLWVCLYSFIFSAPYYLIMCGLSACALLFHNIA